MYRLPFLFLSLLLFFPFSFLFLSPFRFLFFSLFLSGEKKFTGIRVYCFCLASGSVYGSVFLSPLPSNVVSFPPSVRFSKKWQQQRLVRVWFGLGCARFGFHDYRSVYIGVLFCSFQFFNFSILQFFNFSNSFNSFNSSILQFFNSSTSFSPFFFLWVSLQHNESCMPR